jgi:hypothetical protein
LGLEIIFWLGMGIVCRFSTPNPNRTPTCDIPFDAKLKVLQLF